MLGGLSTVTLLLVIMLVCAPCILFCETVEEADQEHVQDGPNLFSAKSASHRDSVGYCLSLAHTALLRTRDAFFGLQIDKI